MNKEKLVSWLYEKRDEKKKQVEYYRKIDGKEEESFYLGMMTAYGLILESIEDGYFKKGE